MEDQLSLGYPHPRRADRRFLAYLVFGEEVTLLKGIGRAVILVGIYLSLH
ncbi:hypothetical protein LR032_00575 [Candidatus Bipolaricaulota bacterium]|nr:hypothetical protein [Candidatus Bipolaricaulota bacterium]